MIFDYLTLFKHAALKGSVPGWVSQYSDQEGTSHFVGGSSNVRLWGAFLWNCLVSLEKNPTISFSRVGKGLQNSHTHNGLAAFIKFSSGRGSLYSIRLLPSVISDILQFRTRWSDFSASTGRSSQSLSCTEDGI